MKYLFGLLVIANVALLVWGMGGRGFLSGESSPAPPVNPDLIEVLPPVVSEPVRTTPISPAEPRPADPSASAGAVADIQPEEDAPVAAEAVVTPLNDSTDDAMVRHVADEEPFCLLLGAYDSELARTRGSRQLNEMGIPFHPYDVARGKITGYRVYLGPYSTDKMLKQARDELGRKGITDVFVLREGENQYLSLGFFSSSEGAARYAAGLRAKGVPVRQRTDYMPLYWLIVTDRDDALRLKKSHFPGYPKDEARARRDCPASVVAK